MSGQAYIGRVIKIGPIPGADFIVHATVDCAKGGRWHGVVRKDEIGEGYLVEVYLPDSLLPATDPRFAFMESKRYRVRQAKFKGCPSQCLIMPMSSSLVGSVLEVGQDITDLIGVTKYEKPVPAQMAGQAKGSFPAFVPKTDEMLYQKAAHLIEALNGRPYYITLKYDGCSGTAYMKNGHFGVCSRNLELNPEGGSVWCEVAKKYELEKRLRLVAELRNLAIQFEVVGPGIQGNPAGLREREIRIFDIFDIDAGVYFPASAIQSFCRAHGLPMVDVVSEGEVFDFDEAQLLYMAEIVKYANLRPGEGIVVRSQAPRMVGADRLSFKVVNLNYKD